MSTRTAILTAEFPLAIVESDVNPDETDESDEALLSKERQSEYVPTKKKGATPTGTSECSRKTKSSSSAVKEERRCDEHIR
jgi:hypothetical protein